VVGETPNKHLNTVRECVPIVAMILVQFSYEIWKLWTGVKVLGRCLWGYLTPSRCWKDLELIRK
jgi:hypothetical protein